MSGKQRNPLIFLYVFYMFPIFCRGLCCAGLENARVESTLLVLALMVCEYHCWYRHLLGVWNARHDAPDMWDVQLSWNTMVSNSRENTKTPGKPLSQSGVPSREGFLVFLKVNILIYWCSPNKNTCMELVAFPVFQVIGKKAQEDGCVANRHVPIGTIQWALTILHLIIIIRWK